MRLVGRRGVILVDVKFEAEQKCKAGEYSNETGAIHTNKVENLPHQAARRGNRIKARPSPGMASQDAARTQVEPPTDAVRANGLLDIVGTGRSITAATLHPGHNLQRGEDHAIRTDEKDENRPHEPLSMANFSKKATRESGLEARLLALFEVGVLRPPVRASSPLSDFRLRALPFFIKFVVHVQLSSLAGTLISRR